MLSAAKKVQQGKALVQAAREARASRLAEERERMDEIKARATPVAGCGPAIPVAPARGAQAAFMPRAMVPDGTVDGFKVADAGWRGFRAVRCLDVFDRMAVSARRRKQSFGLTHGQVAMGRRYRALVEYLASDGTRLSSLDASRGSGDSGNWMDRRMQISDELAMLQHRIGSGVALSVRRVRPSDRGADHRGPIHDRRLVDMVCLEDFSLDDVLRTHGWAVKGLHRKAVQEALSAALDRMIGYRGKKTC